MHTVSDAEIAAWGFVAVALGGVGGALAWDAIRNRTRHAPVADERGYGDWPDPHEHVDHDPAWDEEPMPGRCARSRGDAGEEKEWPAV